MDIIRNFAKQQKKSDDESKFKKQKETAAIVSPIASDRKEKKDKVHHPLIKFLENTFLGRLLFGFSRVLAPLLAFIGGTQALKAAAKFVPGLAPKSAVRFNKAGMPIDEKGRFVPQDKKNMK